MFFNERRIKKMNKAIYGNDPKFYHSGLRLSELKDLFRHYKQRKNLRMPLTGTMGYFFL